MNHGATAQTVFTVAFRKFRTRKKSMAHSQPQNMPQVHSSAEQNVSYYFETQHHARLKWPTVVIFVVTKHIVVDSLRVHGDDVILTTLKQWCYVIHIIIIQTMYKMIYWCLFSLHHGVMFNASRYMWLYVLIVRRGLWWLPHVLQYIHMFWFSSVLSLFHKFLVDSCEKFIHIFIVTL